MMSERLDSLAASSKSGDEFTPYEVQSKPSAIIKSCQKTITISDKAYDLTLVTMKRSFLLVVKSAESIRPCIPQFVNVNGSDADMSDEELVQGFMDVNPPLKGLCLAIGDHSTCLIPSENSLASSSLAIRLSKKLNLNRPVYVVSDIQAPTDTFDAPDVMSRLYLKIFQFVGANYRASQSDDSKIDQ